MSSVQTSEKLWVSNYLLAVTPDAHVADFINKVKKELYINIGSFEERNGLPCLRLAEITANSVYSSKIISSLVNSIQQMSDFDITLSEFTIDFSNAEVSVKVDVHQEMSYLSEALMANLNSQFRTKSGSLNIRLATELNTEQLAVAKEKLKKVSLGQSFKAKSVTLFKQEADGSLQALRDFKLLEEGI